MPKFKVCTIRPNGVSPCAGLDEVLESDDGRGTKYQGLKLQTLIDMKSGKFSRHLVVLKSGKHSKRGLVFNLCPFCGEELLAGALNELTNSKESARKNPELASSERTIGET